MEEKKKATPCESCEFYDYDEDYGDNVCTAALDEDEMLAYRQRTNSRCPYYRYYDEYKSVRRQI